MPLDEPASRAPNDPAGGTSRPDASSLRDRLPDGFKAEMAEQKRKAEADAEAIARQARRRLAKGTALGAAASAGIGLMLEMDPAWFVLVLALTGGGAAWLLVKLRRGHLGGILIYGCAGIAMTYAALFLGVGFRTASLILAWALYLVVGALLAMGSDPDRSMTGMD